jgi:mannose-6-phosphate isomerase
LERHQVEKPWGRTDIPEIFGRTNGRRVGEVWFEASRGEELPLLIKYIFTSENLSVQVHPNDAEARARGRVRGKSECWYIIDAEPGSTLGLGLREETSTSKLREAALGEFLDELMEWKPVRKGDFFYVPAGTIHAIGAGITLLEFQQNADVTYRLYDYGRQRELHLEEALAVATAAPYNQDGSGPSGACDSILMNGPIFTLMRVSSDGPMLASIFDRRRWLAPLEGYVRAGEDRASAGECLLVEAGIEVELSSEAVLLCGAEGMI